MKSHIQVPRFLLKRFSHRTSSLNSRQQPVTRDCVYCLHLPDLSITEEDIKELNVQEGYYDKVAEDTLAKIESEFGEMVADLKISLNDKSKKFCVDKYELIIQKFALMTLARSSTMATMVKEKAITGKLLPKLFTPSTMVKTGKHVLGSIMYFITKSQNTQGYSVY